MLLPLGQLISFDDEFAAFFGEQARVEPVQVSNCSYDLTTPRKIVRLEDSGREGWLFLRNKGHTYLLIESARDRRGWNSWFAPDPKRVLAHLKQELKAEPSFGEWASFFPLARQAHREAHRDRGESRNVAYLQELITKLYHAPNLAETLDRHIAELNAQSHQERW
jgi:hypothetical protein